MSGWSGGAVGPYAHCVLAPNPGPMTLDGTNTWLLSAGPGLRSVVVDPGPLDDAHLAAIRELAGEVAVVLLTHRHTDHSEAAAVFAARVGAEVRAADPAWCTGALGLADGQRLLVDGLDVRVVATPGHTSDSVSLLLPGARALLTGDTVLGRGTSVVTHPDGSLTDYLASLHRMRDVVSAHRVRALWPGHGPILDDPDGVLAGYQAHRARRLDQVRDALAAGASTAADVVRAVYGDLDPTLLAAAEQSVRAQLEHLERSPGGSA